MSVSYIPDKVKVRLWGKAAGRCEYDGCNKPLSLDELTKAQFNTAYIAHIIADTPGGPRGHKQLSERLKADMSNLMLLCDAHHRLVDQEDVAGHPVERLRMMKKHHEERIEIVTSIHAEKKSEILLYGARIGGHYVRPSYEEARDAMSPLWYPASTQAIELSLRNSSFSDSEGEYWTFELEHLRRQFKEHVAGRLAHGAISHLSVFAFAPQPLLVELGSLLSDIPAVDVYQRHREPTTWQWQTHPGRFVYRTIPATNYAKDVALNLSLSGTITNDRISAVLKQAHSIWTFTIDRPDNDFLRSREQLQLFRSEFRTLLDRIKSQHGDNAIIHVFPAVSVAVAVEIGRVWMPKADLPLRIYDQNRKLGGFVPVCELSAHA